MKIFCASTGRCGTRFMAEAFKHFTDIPSFHELWPKCINVVNENINNHDDIINEPTQRILDFKIEEIKKKSVDGNYFEANHMFIKTFVSEVVKAFPGEVYCIYIKRNLPDLLRSYTKRGKRDRFPLDFQLNPKWKGNVFQSLKADYSFYEIVAWNYFEVKERFNTWRPYFAKTFELDFERINDLSEWYRLFRRFGIKAKVEKRMPPFDRHSSHLTAESREAADENLRTNWNAKGKFNFKTDAEKLQILRGINVI